MFHADGEGGRDVALSSLKGIALDTFQEHVAYQIVHGLEFFFADLHQA